MHPRSNPPRISVGLFALVVCSGCLPMNVTRSPGVTGVVVDAASGAPVAGAEVLVSRATYVDQGAAPDGATTAPVAPPLSDALANARRPTVTTGADGRFTVPPEKKWVMMIFESGTPSGTVVVRRPGYAPALRDVVGRKQDLGSIALTPEP